MKHLPNIAGGLLGLAFLTFGLNHFLKLLEVGGSGKPSPEVIAFFTATGKSGFMDFVKILEIIGGLLVAIPKTRNFGLLILGPIILNILAFNIFMAGGGAVFQGPVIIVSALAAYLLWAGRKKFCGLIN
ncbi:MAG: hypothetical protein QNL01_10865 [Akkermansiaceae bacterium]|jgi:putative oxidoreductase|tara:strand:+ start:5758 stop:6144 length:387 start_codon:yes stop_codon:yes gene_type:complete